MTTTRVLVVEDDENLRFAVATELTAGGLAVATAADLAGADAALRDADVACVVFDRMLPDGDSLHFVDRLRRRGWAVPVLFLTARDSTQDRVDGFAHGGDDYLVKPFSPAELAARVHVLCRRGGTPRPSVLTLADLELDSARREVRRAGVLLTLSDKEFAVLEVLLIRAGQAVSREELLEHCWDGSADPVANVVDAVVKRLRAKLREPGLIHAVRGTGYRLAAQ